MEIVIDSISENKYNPSKREISIKQGINVIETITQTNLFDDNLFNQGSSVISLFHNNVYEILEKKYYYRNRNEINKILLNNPNLVPLMVRIYTELITLFFDSLFFVEAKDDNNQNGKKRIIIKIFSTLDVNSALNKLSEYDEIIGHELSSKSNNKILVTLEF